MANQLRSLVAQHADGDATLKVIDPGVAKPVEITLTPSMSELLLDLLRHIGSGHAVTLVPIHEELTTQQAANLLNVSRPYLIGLLEKGELRFMPIGRHRRIKAREVIACKAVATRSGRRRWIS